MLTFLAYARFHSCCARAQGEAAYVYAKRGQINTGKDGFLLHLRFKTGVSGALIAPGDGLGLWFTAAPLTLNRTGPFGIAPQLPGGFGLAFHVTPAALLPSGKPVARLSLSRGAAMPSPSAAHCQFAFFSGETTQHVSHVAMEHAVGASGETTLRVATATTGNLHEPPSWQRCFEASLPRAAALPRSQDVYFGVSGRAAQSPQSHRLYDFHLSPRDGSSSAGGKRAGPGPIRAAFGAPVVEETLGAGRRAEAAAVVAAANDLLGSTRAIQVLSEAHELQRAKLRELSTHVTKQMRELGAHLSTMVDSVQVRAPLRFGGSPSPPSLPALECRPLARA